MKDVADFLVHAMMLKEEAAARYDELADAMDVHHNPEVAELLRHLAVYSRRQLDYLREQAAGIVLPRLKPWEYQWRDSGIADGSPFEATHYLMTPYHCLQMALMNERRCQAFYVAQGERAAEPGARRLARELQEREAGHLGMLEKWAADADRPEFDWDMDFDPPTSPA